MHVLVAKKLYAPEEIAGPVVVVLQGATIRDIWRGMDATAVRGYLAEHMPDTPIHVTDLGSWSLAPGYIDLHTHGFVGHDITTGLQEDIEAMACELPRTGVTSFFPTIATLEREDTFQQVRRGVGAAEKLKQMLAAEILGLRLEGPFISRIKKGAQYEPGIRSPDPSEMEALVVAGQGWIRIVDYAPEEDKQTAFLESVGTPLHASLQCYVGTRAPYAGSSRSLVD